MAQSMTFKDAVAAMNRYGQEHRPFVFALDYEKSEGYVIADPLTAETDILFDLHGVTNVTTTTAPRAITWSIQPESFERYCERFAIVRAGLEDGRTRLTNLTVRTPMTIDGTLEEIFHSTTAKYRMCIPGHWVCFSPETFVTIDKNGRIGSQPMKGTIDASTPDVEMAILNNYKETREHVTMVEMMVDELKAVADDVSCERFRFFTRIAHSTGDILQVSSEITGQLKPEYRTALGDLFDALIPAASICGTPKVSTLRLIRDAEQEPRGFYTGVVGYYDGETLDSGVLIRFISQDADGHFTYQSGGGVTIDSKAEKEYREVIQKVYLPSGQC